MPLVVNGLILENRRVLLGLRSAHRDICPNTWALPGGHVNRGESPLAALRRELYEEIGILSLDCRQTSVFDRSDLTQEVVTFLIFIVSRWDGQIRAKGDEHSELAWFKFDEAIKQPDLAFDEYRAIFRALKINNK